MTNTSATDVEGVTPLEGSPDEIGEGLRAMAEAGADELILVLDPITEASIRTLGDIVRRLRLAGQAAVAIARSPAPTGSPGSSASTNASSCSAFSGFEK